MEFLMTETEGYVGRKGMNRRRRIQLPDDTKGMRRCCLAKGEGRRPQGSGCADMVASRALGNKHHLCNQSMKKDV